ncbi:MAG: M20 family metallopeptidase [Peptostreptococcaceae bacterium]
MNIKDITSKYKDYIIEMRREFHANPEASMQEVRTCKRIKEELDKIGVSYVSAANTGVIATIKGKNPGKTVALRADIDALAVCELNEVEYKSKNEGLMHACGHDGHTAMLLGAANVLNEIKDNINGTVKLLFQPGEEAGVGARAMIADGAMEGVDSAFGIHLWADLELGKIAVEEGPRMASADILKITVKGKGGHGSMPNQGIDAVLVSSAIVMNLQSIVSREISPLESVVVSIGAINAGTRFNVIAEDAVLDGTVRCFNPKLREELPNIIERIVKNTASTYRAEASVEYNKVIPITINDKECTKLAKGSVDKLVGEGALASIPKVTGSEDMSEYLNLAPGAIAFVGAGNIDKGIAYPHHHGKFNIDEDALELGTNLYVQYALDFLDIK